MEFGQLHHIEYYVKDLHRSNELWDWFMPFMGYTEYQKFSGGISWRHTNGTYIVFVQVETNFLHINNNRQGNGLNHIALVGKDLNHMRDLQTQLQIRNIKILALKEKYICFEDPNEFAVEIYFT